MWKSEHTLNRLESTRLIGPMVDNHWAELREAKSRGEKIAWASGPSFMYPYAIGMKCHFMAGYASYCAGRHAADRILEIAEADGELRDTCSYHRLHMGMSAAVREGYEVREDVILPMPDLMISGRFCTEQSHYNESLYRRHGIRHVGIEHPSPRKEEDFPRIEEYLVRQINEILIPTLEDVCGKPFDYENFSEIMRMLKKACLVRNECWEFFKKKPLPWTLWDYAVSLAPVIYLMGKPETVPYYEKVRDELAERVEKNIPAIGPDGEKYRIMWDGWIPWAFLSRFLGKLLSKGAAPVCGRYPWEFFPNPEFIDPEIDPIRNFVQVWYSGMRLFYHDSPYGAEEIFSEMIEDYSVDGIIMFSSKTCRLWNRGQLDILSIMEKKYGIPSVIIEADMIDSTMLSDAQIDTRLEALFEMIDGRRKRSNHSR